jgi:hypothetical protein|nr:MAG TPA: Tape measure domain protein [Caudoviricetes sp.]
MSQSRQINFSVNLDTSQVPKQAELSTKAIRAELEKQKAAVDRIMSDLLTSGGKLKVPMDDFKAAATAAGNALDRIGENNARALERLYPKYDQLKAKIKEAYNAGNIGQVVYLQNGQYRAIEIEIQSRERLDKQIRSQWNALDQLNSRVEQSVAASKREEQSAQTLSQKLAELKKRMSELAAASQQDSKEYQECAAKAKELGKALQQLNADAKPDAHVRLRTELMNAKQAMAEAEKEFGRGSIQFQQARDKAIQLQQAMNGMNKQVKSLAAPNATYQGIINGLSGISGAASAATGMMTLFGGESQQTAKAMAKLQAIMSITMGLQSMSMMLNKNSAVQLNIIGRLTTWWAACKAKAAAATTAETGAVVVNTTAQAAQTTAVAAGTTANVAHAASWKAVAIAIKSVPVFGWIVAGITALIAAIELFSDKTDETKSATYDLINAEKRAEAEAERLKNARQEETSTLEDARAELTLSIAKLKAFNGTKEQEKKVVNEMNQKYGETMGYFSSVADWYHALIKNSAAYCQQMIIEARTRSLANQIAQKEQESYNIRYDENGNARTYTYTSGTKATVYYSDGKKMVHVSTGTNEYSKSWEDFQKDTWSAWKQDKSDPNVYYAQQTNTGATPLKQANDALAQNDKAIATLKKRLEQQVEEASQINFEVVGSAFKPGSGDDGGSGGDNHPNPDNVAKEMLALSEAELRVLRERNRQILKLDNEREQAEIDILQDGHERRIRQRALNERVEQQQLQQQLEDQIQAEIDRAKTLHDARERLKKAQAEKEGKTYTVQQFDAGDLYTADIKVGMTEQEMNALATGGVDASRIKAIIEFYNLMGATLRKAQSQRIQQQTEADQLAMNEYLQQYGTYEEKKLAIAAIYAAKRAKATTDAEQMQLAQEENKALNDVEFDDFMTNRAALAFGEIDNLSRSTISRLITEMEQYRDKITQTFDPDKIEKFNRALSDLKRAQAMSEGGLFSQLFTPAFFKERKAAIAEINAAERTHNDLLTAKAQKEEEVKKKIEEIIAKVKELTGQDLTPDQVKDGSTVSNIIGQLGANGNQQGGADLSNLMSGLNGARAELGQVTTASNKAGASLRQLKEAFSAKFTGQGGGLAMVDAIVHGINDIVQGANETVKELASTADALGADTSVGSGWDKAQTFMQGFADASAGATEAFDSLKSGNIMGVVSGVTKSFTSWIKAFAAIHDASRERTIQRLQDEIDELERMNRRIEHNLEKQYSKQASRSYENEIANLEKQRRLIQQQIAAEEDKKNTDDDRIQEWKDQYEELGWKIEEYKDKALDAILGEDISTSIDNFTDKLAESWGRFGDRARATKDFVKSLLRQMVIEAMKTNLAGPIEELRKRMADALSDDVITEQEQAELEAFAQQLADETERKYKWADRIMNDGASDSGSGTTGTFATASQDSITELNGRAAAIHTSGEMRRELLLNIGVDVAELKAQAAASAANSAEMRELQLIAVGHLETIARNTNELYEMNERLDKIERNTRGL